MPKQPGSIIPSISRRREQANVISWLWPRWDSGLYYLAIRETQLQLLISVCVEIRKWPLCCWPIQPAERKRGNMHCVVPCRATAFHCMQHYYWEKSIKRYKAIFILHADLFAPKWLQSVFCSRNRPYQILSNRSVLLLHVVLDPIHMWSDNVITVTTVSIHVCLFFCFLCLAILTQYVAHISVNFVHVYQFRTTEVFVFHEPSP